MQQTQNGGVQSFLQYSFGTDEHCKVLPSCKQFSQTVNATGRKTKRKSRCKAHYFVRYGFPNLSLAKGEKRNAAAQAL